ncbi:MAG TPA: TM0106 family RecB-like putative nuclease [Planctomycetes bacterium]|nr:TM0106 family RecB-like putative nuclease [Planctomycetota bacterium]
MTNENSETRPTLRPSSHAVTGSVVYNHFGHPCAYRLHLDLHGDRDLRCEPAALTRYFMERGNRHEARVFERIQKERPDDCIAIARDPSLPHEEDLERRAAATLEAMREGKGIIFHGVIQSEPGEVKKIVPGVGEEESPFRLRGETDILERVDGVPSDFGDYAYRVGDVKSSRDAQFPQKMQVAFYSLVLSRRQGAMPETGFIQTGADERVDFAIEPMLWTVRLFLEEEIHETWEPGESPFHLTPYCDQCAWRDHCREQAERDDDLSLIPGCRPGEKRALLAMGVRSRTELAAKDDRALRALGKSWGGRRDGFRDLKLRASALEFGRPVPKSDPGALPQAQGGGRVPDPASHRGPFLLVAGVADGFHGEDAALAVWRLRRDDLGREAPTEKAGAVIHHRGTADQPGEMLRRLYREISQTNRLLSSRRESVLPIFLSRSLPYRFRRLAESLGGEAVAARFVEEVLCDAVVLPEWLDRRFHLPLATFDVEEAARLFGIEVASAPPGAHPEVAERVQALAADFGFAGETLCEATPHLRRLAVREMRDDSAPVWRDVIERSLLRDLEAGARLMGHLLKGRRP